MKDVILAVFAFTVSPTGEPQTAQPIIEYMESIQTCEAVVATLKNTDAGAVNGPDGVKHIYRCITAQEFSGEDQALVVGMYYTKETSQVLHYEVTVSPMISEKQCGIQGSALRHLYKIPEYIRTMSICIPAP